MIIIIVIEKDDEITSPCSNNVIIAPLPPGTILNSISNPFLAKIPL
jgi:hypothetical protein